MIDPTPAGRSTTMITSTTPTVNMYDVVIEYLRSLNVSYTLTDYGIKVTLDNAVIEMYIYNSTWMLHAIITARNDLSSDMYVKEINDIYGTTLITYDKQRIKISIKMKLSGNTVYDYAVPLIAIARAVELIGKPLNNLLPPSLW
jgi:hypothetical protein